VAGHEAHVLLLSPRDGFRFGYRLWADKDSGLLLRAEVFNDRDVVLESSAFSDLIIGAKPQPELVTRAMKKLDGYRIVRPVLEPVELQAEGWSLRDAPPGFDHVSSVRRSMAANDAADTPGPGAPVLQSIYSDGLTYVSVFIEPFVPDLHKRESLMMFGATQTLVRRDGDWWVTVIGDVPVVTLRAFASGLKRR
jgi:sigma-E factor negative regulatory protein RseB